jgi:predicted ATP-dependent protease
MDMIQNQNIIITVDGKRVGQVNGLAVYDMGDYAFGRINRITCTTSVTDDGIFNIDRASKLSGNIHDKGVYILSGFLNSLLSREQSLGFSASVCFEQSYGMIDGDSASVTELVAVVSALANIPILQNFAMTGSINQFGEIQPVGGINEKVEGFFKTCRMLGKDKSYSVIIPHQNVENLMLSFEAQSAIKSGFLKIFPVKHVREAFELATGHRFGIDLITDKKFVLGSALDIIHKKLQTVHDSEKEFHESHHHKKPESAPSAAKGLRMRR